MKQPVSTIEELVANMDLTLTRRGTRYARIIKNDKALAVFRGDDWQVAARAWLAGWRQSQMEHELCSVKGQVLVNGHLISYFWAVPLTLAQEFRDGADRWAREHVRDELRRGASRGLMGSIESDGGHTFEALGWWWSGNEKEVLSAKEEAAYAAGKLALQNYLGQLRRVCSVINEVIDRAKSVGEWCELEREGAPMGRIHRHSECRYHWIATHLSVGGRRRTIRLAPECVEGTGAGKYIIRTCSGNRTEITIPDYPEVAIAQPEPVAENQVNPN